MAIIFFGSLCCLTSVLILYTAKKTKLYSIGEIAYRVYGVPGVIITNLAYGISQLGFCIGMLYFNV